MMIDFDDRPLRRIAAAGRRRTDGREDYIGRVPCDNRRDSQSVPEYSYMIKDAPAEPTGSASATDAAADPGLMPQMLMMFDALWASPVRNALFAMSTAIFIVVAATAYGQILLNNWNKPFYDALSRRISRNFSRSSACSA
jgi:hypothetical protein